MIAAPALASLTAALTAAAAPDAIERRFGLDLSTDNRPFDCAVHHSHGLGVIEFEPHARNDFADHVSMIVPVIAQLEQASSLGTLCDTAARLVRQMTGYDRVMIYRFHPDESGEVIAEDRHEDLESFKGLRYPAADIPQQARELFRRNRFRIIADMHAPAVPILPASARAMRRSTCRCQCCVRTRQCTLPICATWAWARALPSPSSGTTGCGA